MDFSAANTALWSPIIQIGIIAGAILLANTLRRKVRFFRESLMPTAVLAGFLLLLVRSLGLVQMDATFLETLTYHALALGFIAQSLRIPEKQEDDGNLTGMKSGALIVSTYMVQGGHGVLENHGDFVSASFTHVFVAQFQQIFAFQIYFATDDFRGAIGKDAHDGFCNSRFACAGFADQS